MHFTALLSLTVAALGVCIEGLAPRVPESSNVCRKPTKRREWRDMKRSEQKAFIDAVKCLGSLPHDTKIIPTDDSPGTPPLNTTASHYDDFVYAHIDSNARDHFTALFLPWHRWYIHTFLDTLQTKCNYKGELPYWNWSRDVKNVTASAVFNSDPKYGLGTFGAAENGYALADGAFGGVVRAYPTPHVIVRHYEPYPFRIPTFPFAFTQPDIPATDYLTPEVIQGIVDGSKGNFTDFAYKIDGVRAQGPHNAAHLMMRGEMTDLAVSPNDVLFWMHHTHLDCIWAKWQNRRPENKNAYGGGLLQDMNDFDRYPVGAPPAASFDSELPTVGLTGPVKVSEVMSTKGEYLCYECVW